MNNRTILTGLLGAGTVASATAQTPAKTKAQTPQGRPNIVIIYTDDMGIGDLSCTSTGWIETPAIDRLASQGLVLNSYYTSAPVSSPSRVGLTTGMFPMEWGINTYLQSRKGNAACEQADYLTAAAPSMARILRDAGYATGHFGKWHMGGGRDVKDAPSIPSFGFDEYCSTWESPDPAPELTATNWIWSDKDDVKRWNRTGYFVDKTLDFLVRHKDKPCFVNLWPDDMHTPWIPDEESQHKQKDWNSQPNFSEVLAEYDRQIGRFLTQLDQLGLSDNTIVIFTSDNGPGPELPPAAHERHARREEQPLRRRHPHAVHHPLARSDRGRQGRRHDGRLRCRPAALALQDRQSTAAERLPFERRGHEPRPARKALGPQRRPDVGLRPQRSVHVPPRPLPPQPLAGDPSR